ncbi:23910_t:CDS:2, partial [Gigaspora margarita]
LRVMIDQFDQKASQLKEALKNALNEVYDWLKHILDEYVIDQRCLLWIFVLFKPLSLGPGF